MNGFWVCGIISLIIYCLLYDWAFIFIYALMVGGYFGLAHIFVPESAAKFNSPRRKLNLATWGDPDSPEVHGHFKVRIAKSLQFIEDFNKATGKKLTITHLVMKMAADTMAEFPEFTGKLVCGCYVKYDTVDISCLVNLDGGKDLAFFAVTDANNKSLQKFCEEFEEKVESLRHGEGRKMHNKATGITDILPPSISGVLIELTGFISTVLGLDLPMWGIKRHMCGSMTITNIGANGLEVGYAPFPPVIRVPGILALSSIRDQPVIDNGQIIIDKILTINFTMDHRFGDGTRGTKAMGEMKRRLENPYECLKIE